MTDYPNYTIQLEHIPGAKGSSWYATLLRQDRKYAKRQQLNKGQGPSLEIALTALAHGAKLQALKYPELAA